MAIATVLLIFLCILLAADIIISLNTHRDLKREVDEATVKHDQLKRKVYSISADAMHARNDLDNALADIYVFKKRIQQLEAAKEKKATRTRRPRKDKSELKTNDKRSGSK